MSLPYLPQFYVDPNGDGGLYGGSAGAALAAGASTTVAFAFGAGSRTTAGYPSQCVSARLQAICHGGTAVSTTAGLQVQIYSTSATQIGGGVYATMPIVTATVSTVNDASIDLPIGIYEAKLTNLDATNAINVGLSLGYKA